MKTKLSFLVAAFWLGCLPAQASDFDSSRNLLCASTGTVECVQGSDCLEGTAASINVPQFFWISFAKKLIEAKRANGEKVSSKIVTKSHDNGQMVLQGTQNQLGWSMAIMEKSGQMVLTASGEGVAYVVFGACTPFR